MSNAGFVWNYIHGIKADIKAKAKQTTPACFGVFASQDRYLPSNGKPRE